MELKSITASAVITEIAFRIDSWRLITSSDTNVSPVVVECASAVSECVRGLIAVLPVSVPSSDSTLDFGVVQRRLVAISMGQHPAFTRIRANSIRYFIQVSQKCYIIALCAVWGKIHILAGFSYPPSYVIVFFGPGPGCPDRPLFLPGNRAVAAAARSFHPEEIAGGHLRAVGAGQLLDAAVSAFNPVPPTGTGLTTGKTVGVRAPVQ